MQEKTKKYLLSFAVRTAVAVGLFLVIFAVCKIFPQLLRTIRPAWTNSMDIRKIGALLHEVLKEALP